MKKRRFSKEKELRAAKIVKSDILFSYGISKMTVCRGIVVYLIQIVENEDLNFIL